MQLGHKYAEQPQRDHNFDSPLFGEQRLTDQEVPRRATTMNMTIAEVSVHGFGFWDSGGDGVGVADLGSERG